MPLDLRVGHSNLEYCSFHFHAFEKKAIVEVASSSTVWPL